jgi:hypothetical protein
MPITDPNPPPQNDPVLPPWVPPDQPPNPTGINPLGNTVSERTLTISPWGNYVPIIFGRDVVGGQISLWYVSNGFLYLRMVWCIGEVQSIDLCTLEDGTVPEGTTFTHYTGTASQAADPTLSGLITGYTDTMRDIGYDNYSLCYSVIKCTISSLDSFPKFRATIKGLKVKNPIPSFLSSVVSGGDTVFGKGDIFTITDDSANGSIIHTIRYEDDELIDSEEYAFSIEVLAISDMGAGTALVEWCDVSLIDTNTALQMDLNAVGVYDAVATFSPFSPTKNHLDIIVSGANNGVEIQYQITVYNSLGNGVLTYSNIAGACLNHLITDPVIGLGLTADLASYRDLVVRNKQVLTHDELSVEVYREPRSIIGLTISRKASLTNYIELLRGYSRCMLSNRGGVMYYNLLEATPVSFTLTESDMLNFKPFVKRSGDVPNKIRVYYTDTYTSPWKDNYVQIEAPEVTSGAEYERVAVYRMNGFQTRTAAKRYGYDRMNERLRLFGVKFRAYEAVYDHYEGETFTMSHPILGIGTFKMKIFSKVKIKHGMWEIVAELDNDAIYSNEIADYDPDAGGLDNPNPYDFIDATDLSVSVEVPQYQNGVYFTTMRCTWTGSLYNYNFFYRLELYNNATDELIDTSILDKSAITGTFNNVQENILYRIELKIITFGSNVSDGISTIFLPLGKDFPPTDVSGFYGYEANGTVTLKWADAVDNQEIVHYYIQYGVADFEWNDNDSKILSTRIDAKELMTNNVLVGTWDFLIKAVDNAGNESTNAARLSDIVVHLNSEFDTNTFGEFPRTINTTDSTGLESIYSGRTTRHTVNANTLAEVDWITKSNASMTATFTNAMNTYPNSLMSYGAGVANVLYSEIKDFGADYEGQFSLDTGSDEYWTETNEAYTSGGEMIESLDTANPVTKVMQLSTAAAPTTWTDYSALIATTTARYMRLKLTSPNLTSRWRFNQGALKYRLYKTITTQEFQGTTSSGTLTVTLDSSTSDMRLMTVSLNENTTGIVVINKVGSSPWSSVLISVYDSKFILDTTAREVSGVLKYI